MLDDFEVPVRIDSIANGAVGDLMTLLGTNIKLKKIEVIAATVETYIDTGVRTLAVTYRIEPDMNPLGDKSANQ